MTKTINDIRGLTASQALQRHRACDGSLRAPFLEALGKITADPARRVMLPTGTFSVDEIQRVLRALELARGQSDKT